MCCAFGVSPDALCQVGRLKGVGLALGAKFVVAELFCSLCKVQAGCGSCARCAGCTFVACTGVANKVLFKVLKWCRSWSCFECPFGYC